MLRPLPLIAVLCAAPFFFAEAQTHQRGVCFILALEGAGRVLALGVGSRPAEVGLGLGRNATLRTGEGARATLDCDGNLRVVVGPGSEFQVLRIVDAAPRTLRLKIIRGIAGFIFDGSDADGGVQVRTPSAVAAVRSTAWAMQVADGDVAVFARDGTVFVVNETGSARLGPGDGVDVTANGTLGGVVQWGQPRIDLLSTLLGPSW